MRREWTATIKNRRWEDFEKLARTEPDQILCDTVAELERGFTEKADRKALKKVLWILEKAGYEPQEIEEQAAEEPQVDVAPVAFMTSADSSGETPVTYGYFDGNHFRWLTVYLHEIEGVVRAGDESMSLEEGMKRAEVLRAGVADPFVSAEVDPGFVLWRIKRGVSKGQNHRLPSTIAHWRTIIDRATEVPHPAESLQVPKRKKSDKQADILFLDPTMGWRIEFGAATPVLEKMSQAIKGAPDEVSKAELSRLAKEEATSSVITDSMIEEHAMRLLDLAWLMHLKSDPEVGDVLVAREELLKARSGSHYAMRLVDKTIVMYFQWLKSKEAEQSAQAGGALP
jgi:hypothetical protein